MLGETRACAGRSSGEAVGMGFGEDRAAQDGGACAGRGGQARPVAEEGKGHHL